MSSPAAIVGAEAGCPFCIARLASFPAFGDSVLLLNGYKAGVKYTVLKTDRLCRRNEFIAAEEHGDEGSGVRCSRDNELYLPLPSAPAPSFMPSFDLRRSFIIEDVVRSFCDAGLEGKKFIVTDSMMHHLIYVCWKKRLRVSPAEVVSLLLAHGMPIIQIDVVERLFSYGIDTLVYAAGRKPVRKWRQRFPAIEKL